MRDFVADHEWHPFTFTYKRQTAAAPCGAIQASCPFIVSARRRGARIP